MKIKAIYAIKYTIRERYLKQDYMKKSTDPARYLGIAIIVLNISELQREGLHSELCQRSWEDLSQEKNVSFY